MDLFLISQIDNNEYDTYDAAVVAANNYEDARTIHPAGAGAIGTSDWVSDTRQVRVVRIGEAASCVRRGVVLASYNPG